MTRNTRQTRREIDGNVSLASVYLTSVDVPRTQHRPVSAPVLMVQPSVTDVDNELRQNSKTQSTADAAADADAAAATTSTNHCCYCTTTYDFWTRKAGPKKPL